MFSNPFAPDDVGREKKVQKSSFLGPKKDLDSNMREPEPTLIMKLDMELLEKTKRELNEKPSKSKSDSFVPHQKNSSTTTSFLKLDNISGNPKAELARKIIEVAFKPSVSVESLVGDRFLPDRAYYQFDLVARGNECHPRLVIRDKNEWTRLIKNKQMMDEEAHAIEHVIDILRNRTKAGNSMSSNSADRSEEKQLSTDNVTMQRNSSQQHNGIEHQTSEEE
jgi:hypothetical protein